MTGGDDEEFLASIGQLSTPVLVRLYEAMYDTVGSQERAFVKEVLWERHAIQAPWIQLEHQGGFQYTMCCAKSRGPNDPAHYAMVLDVEGMRDRRCYCGSIDLTGWRDRSLENPRVWPMVTFEVAGQLIPHFVVCRHALPADPRHAPPPYDYLDRCICGAFYGRDIVSACSKGAHVECTGEPTGCLYTPNPDSYIRVRLFPAF